MELTEVSWVLYIAPNTSRPSGALRSTVPSPFLPIRLLMDVRG